MGIDINQSIVEENKWRKGGSTGRNLFLNVNNDPKLEGFNKTFKYLVAQNALMHLLWTYVRKCFCNTRKIIQITYRLIFT